MAGDPDGEEVEGHHLCQEGAWQGRGLTCGVGQDCQILQRSRETNLNKEILASNRCMTSTLYNETERNKIVK